MGGVVRLSARVLIVDDDYRTARSLAAALRQYELAVSCVGRGRDALYLCSFYDVVLLYLEASDVDGIELCRAVREVSGAAVIALVNRAGVDDVIRVLNAGADDCLPTPCDVDELAARMGAVLRRRSVGVPRLAESVRIGEITVDLQNREVRRAGATAALSEREYEVLALIASERGAACPRQRIIAQVWRRQWKGANRTLDYHVGSLRAKLGRDVIETVRGFGYRLGTPLPRNTGSTNELKGAGVCSAAAEDSKRSGITVWFTGLPSSGKSTIAKGLSERLRSERRRVEILDGDILRQHLTPDLGYSRSDRIENVRRIGFLATMFARHDIVVLVPVIAPYAAARRQVRDLHERQGLRLLEVYVATPVDICARRDVKGLYAKQRAGELTGLTGVDDPYESPVNPDLRVPAGRQSVAESVDSVYQMIVHRYPRLAAGGVRGLAPGA
jgi:adenylylsulfate kinase